VLARHPSPVNDGSSWRRDGPEGAVAILCGPYLASDGPNGAAKAPSLLLGGGRPRPAPNDNFSYPRLPCDVKLYGSGPDDGLGF
jgi:hypothetical protein